MYNKDIRDEVRESGLKLWQIAEALGVTDSSFSRMLRRELTEEKKTQIRGIIADLTEKGAANAR